MAYTPTIWNENDIITAEKLNNIENGVSEVGGVYELELTEEELNQATLATSTSPFVKDIAEEDYLKIENSNLIKLHTGDISSFCMVFNRNCHGLLPNKIIYFLNLSIDSLMDNSLPVSLFILSIGTDGSAYKLAMISVNLT